MRVDLGQHVGPHFVGEFDNHARSRTCPACNAPPDPRDTDWLTVQGDEPPDRVSQSLRLPVVVTLTALVLVALLLLSGWRP